MLLEKSVESFIVALISMDVGELIKDDVPEMETVFAKNLLNEFPEFESTIQAVDKDRALLRTLNPVNTIPALCFNGYANMVAKYKEKRELRAFSGLSTTHRYLAPLNKTKRLEYVWLHCLTERFSPELRDQRYHLRQNVAIMEYDHRSWLVYIFEQICRKGALRCVVAMSEEAHKKITKAKEIVIKPIYNFKTCMGMIKTMRGLEKLHPELMRAIKEPNLDMCRLNFTTNNNNNNNNSKGFSLVNEEAYNEAQKQAIKTCLNTLEAPADEIKIQLIQGPPGTGKTYTLVGIVKNIIAKLVKGAGRSICLMICAPSNGAIDNVARALLKEEHFFNKTLNRRAQFIRLGNAHKIDEEVMKIFWTKHKPLRKQVDIILATLGSSHHFFMELEGFQKNLERHPIDAVIIDEACQASVPELLMPMRYARSPKMILVGDPAQLSATVHSGLAMKMNLGRSLFDYFGEHFKRRGEVLPMLTLNEQFRMKPEIVRFPSNMFYQGQLVSACNAGANPDIKLHPYTVFDLTDTQEMSEVDSKHSVKEAKFINRLLHTIIDGYKGTKEEETDSKAKKFPHKIGIITFYVGQKKVLAECIDAELREHVHIGTVDGFQGREMSIIILSCVRSDSLGFLRDSRRLNVSLTRAMSALFVCLNVGSFADGSVSCWWGLVNDAQERRRLYTINSEYLSDEELAEVVKLDG